MMNNDMYLMKNFDFLAQSFARMNAQGQPVDLVAEEGADRKLIENFNLHVKKGQRIAIVGPTR
mgnify:CR=1 FL=1